MKKLKWSYSRKTQTYFANDGDYRICKNDNKSYELVIYQNKYCQHDIPFKKLSTAKKVGKLIFNG